MIENVKCPICDGPMASRANKTTGQRFWGCKRFPICKGTRNTDGEAQPAMSYLTEKAYNDTKPVKVTVFENKRVIIEWIDRTGAIVSVTQHQMPGRSLNSASPPDPSEP